MSFLWVVIIGFLAGLLAKIVTPGDNEVSGFALTAILGIISAVVVTYTSRALGWHQPGTWGDLLCATLGAAVVLGVWSILARRI